LTSASTRLRLSPGCMDQLPSILQRLASTNELMVYALLCLGVLTFLGLLMTTVGVYRANQHHREALEVLREILGASDRLGYYLFKKLGPIEIPLAQRLRYCISPNTQAAVSAGRSGIRSMNSSTFSPTRWPLRFSRRNS